MTGPQNEPQQTPVDDSPIWRFRGYELDPKDFTNAMLELYRGEQQRSNTWRTRLDSTTQWTVITSLATFLYLFTSPDHHYIMLVLNSLLVAIFMWIEARRYRYYELWSYRVRLMETDFFAAMLVPPFGPHSDWAEQLAHTLLKPEFPITLWEALGRRLRRNYLWVFLLLGAAWALKGYLHPTPAVSWDEFLARNAVGPISGLTMTVLGLLFNGVLLVIGLATVGMREASGEVLHKHGELPLIGELREALESSELSLNHTGGGARRRAQQLALVVTAHPQDVADHVLNDMHRGATALAGRGMYTGQERDVLMIAVTTTELAHLEQLVRERDPNAFVILVPAQEVLGRGFQPLMS